MQRAEFDHEKLDVFKAAVAFAVWRRRILGKLPRGNGDLADQIRRASTSIAANIAEGCGERSLPDRAHFYRIARRSATECAAILSLCEEFGPFRRQVLEEGRGLLLRIVAMLTALERKIQETCDLPGPAPNQAHTKRRRPTGGQP